MAVSATNKATAGNNVDASSFATASITPTANKLILAWVYSIAATAPNVATATGNGLTYVQIDSQLDTDSVRRITLFRAMGSSPSSGAITFDFAGQTQTGCAWSVVEYDGTDISGTNGSGAIVQSAKNSSTAATSLTVTLAAFSSTNNGTAGGFGIPLNTAGQPAAGSGFAATGQVNQASPNLSIGSEFRNDNDTTVNMTSGAASIPWVGIAVEIKAGIAFDAASNSGYQAASSSYSWSHTCTGADRYLVVGVAMLSLAQTVSSITYNSVNLTLIGVRASISGAARVELWGLTAPTTGSNTIAVTLSGSIASASIATSLTAVHQTSPIEAFNSAQATNVGAADATVDVTTVASNDWIIDIIATDDTAITVGSGQTQRGNVTGLGGSGAMSTEGPKASAGAVTMSWTDVGALATWATGAVAIRPLTASSLANHNALLLMGVG